MPITTVRGSTSPVVTTPTTAPAAATTTPAAPVPSSTTPAAATFGGTTTTTPAAPVTTAAVGGSSLFNVRTAVLAGRMDPALMAALATPAGLKAQVDKLSAVLVQSQGKAITPQQEKAVFENLAKLQAAGQLRPALEMMAAQAQQSGTLPADMPAAKKEALLVQFQGMIESEI